MENKETFAARIDPFFSRVDANKIKLAYVLSKFGHRHQTRKETDANGNPLRYFEHVRRVTLTLMDEAKIMDANMIIAAILHDAFEDSYDMTPELIEFTFGPDVVSIIKKLSKTPKEGYLERLMICNDWRPIVIKACDRLDNLRSLMVPGTSLSFQKKQIAETKEKYLPLFTKMMKMVPNEYIESALHLRDEILKMVTECEVHIQYREKQIAAEDQEPF